MTDQLPQPPGYFVERLCALQAALRDHVRAARDAAAMEEMAAVGECRDGDTLYAIDLHSEEILLRFCAEWAKEMPFVLIAEGLPGSGWRVFPEDASEKDARFCVIVDPIDGTRGLMYDKRSAWVLSGIAPNRGPATSLADVVVAMQTEIPTTRQYLADTLWATRGGGAHAERRNLLTGETHAFTPQPSGAVTLAHGFAGITKFFPGGRDLVASLEEELFQTLLGTPADGNPLVFDDQYISTGGQLYEMMVGHDRFNADLRPLALAARYPGAGAHRLCCHPYDICTELIAREAGVIVADPWGDPLAAPLDIREDVGWAAYANEAIRAQVQPVLTALLRRGDWGGSL